MYHFNLCLIFFFYFANIIIIYYRKFCNIINPGCLCQNKLNQMTTFNLKIMLSFKRIFEKLMIFFSLLKRKEKILVYLSCIKFQRDYLHFKINLSINFQVSILFKSQKHLEFNYLIKIS